MTNNLDIAMKYFNEKDYARAVEAFRAVLDEEPASASIYNNLGVCHYNMEKFEQAIVFYEKALELDSNIGDIYLNLGFACYAIKNIARAIENLELAVRLFPDNFDARYILANLGLAYLDVDRIDSAIFELNKAIELDNENFRLYFILGEAYILDNRIEEAIESFKETLKRNPNYYFAYKKLGLLYLSLGKNHEASGMLTIYQELNPEPDVEKLLNRLKEGETK